MFPQHRSDDSKSAASIAKTYGAPIVGAIFFLAASSCTTKRPVVNASSEPVITVGVTPVVKKSLSRTITISSELVPFEEIDVYAKQAGYVRTLNVDYGTHVKKGQVMATLEIPELEAQLQADQAEIANATNEIDRAEHELKRYQAQYTSVHLQYTRLNGVSENQPGIVAQQEVDDAQGKDMAAESQVEAGKAALDAARSNLSVKRARLLHDQALFDYSKIVAPFSGVVTERYANLGALMQAGTSSSTQAMPLVKLSQDDVFRLVIPIPEAYVRYVQVGDPVKVHIPALNRNYPGKVARFSVDVREDTRTMHTEVDVPNEGHTLMPGLFAEAEVSLERRTDIPTVPLQAINREHDRTTVYVVNQDDELEDHPVSLGIQSDTDAEVVSGLRAGEQVVISDRSGLRPNEKVQTQAVPVMRYQESE